MEFGCLRADLFSQPGNDYQDNRLENPVWTDPTFRMPRWGL
jgi:hypothetical protein